jgi:hypothetical protein
MISRNFLENRKKPQPSSCRQYSFGLKKDYGIMNKLVPRLFTLRDLFRFLFPVRRHILLLSFFPPPKK